MPSLVLLAEEILAQAKKLEGILEQNNLSSPSFDQDTLESLPDDAQKLRSELLDNSHIFKQLVRGARASGLDIASGWTETVVLRIIWRYKLASAVPVDGSATYQEISKTSALSPSLTVRTIRTAIAMGMFDESEPGRVCHTAMSRLLVTSEGYYNLVGLHIEDIGPASSKLIEAWEKFGVDAGEPDQSAFSLHSGGKSLFAVLAQDREMAHRFDSAMKYSVEDKDINHFNIIHGFDWTTLDTPSSTLIDLGGGIGHMSLAIAKQTQNLTFIVQDLPHVIEKGKASLPSEFADRIFFEPQNFMEPQRPRDKLPNAYLISRCLHNWSDQHSLQILRSLVPTLQKGSKVLIWDMVLDATPTKKFSEKFSRQQDLIMATISNGKDRSAEEFRELFKVSDERFVVENVKKPKGSKLSLIEVSWGG